MSDRDPVENLALTCLRLAAECKNLAADVPDLEVRARFLSLARRWTELADQPRVLHGFLASIWRGPSFTA
jgi:hypothetical protein